MIFNNNYWVVIRQQPRPSRLGTGVIVFLLLWAILLVLLSPETGLGAGEIYRVGILQNPPKVFVDTDGRSKGIYVDLLDHIAQNEGWHIEYVPCVWEECLGAVRRGDIDLLVDVASTPERKRDFTFNKEPVLKNWAEVFMRDGKEVKSPLDLKGKTIAVLKDEIHGNNFKALLIGMGVKYKLKEVKSYEEAFRAVSAHQADAAVVNNLFGFDKAKIYGLDTANIIFSPVDLHIVTGKNGPAGALDIIDEYMKAWMPDKKSFYGQTLKKWLHNRDHWEMPQWAYWASGLLLALLVVLSGAVTISRHTIRSRTQQLGESETRYRALFDKSGDAMFIHDLSGRFLEVNQAACDRQGYSRDEMLRMSVPDIDTPEFATAIPERVNLLRAKGELVFESVHVTKQGERIPVEIMSTLVTFKGAPAMFSTARDLRERIKAQEEIKRNEEIYRLHFENASDVIFMVDNELKIINISPSVQDCLGYKAEELEGRRFFELPIFPAEGVEVAKNRLQRVLGGERLDARFYRLIAKGGQEKFAEINSSPTYKGKNVIGIVSVARDITERKKAEDKLQKAMADLEQALGGTVELLTATLERRDPYTSGHQERVADLACAIAEEMGLDQNIGSSSLAVEFD